jgi:hypothetical protein
MTRQAPATGVLAHAGDPAKTEEDKNKVCDYVKDELFERVIFVWDKVALQPNGVLHQDYMKNCKAQLADGKLIDAMDSDAETYMNLVWTIIVKENCYQTWLSNKRSNTYQAVQDLFMSKCCSIERCSLLMCCG